MAAELATGKAIAKFVDIAIEQGWIDKLLSAFIKKRRVLLLGSTGVGKTNFLNSLKRFPPEAISYLNRTKYASGTPLKIKRNFILVDTPGDIGYHDTRLQAIRQNMSRGKNWDYQCRVLWIS